MVNYRDSDSLRVINKLWLNVNSDNTFEVSKTCTFCQETNIENVCLYLIPGLEVTELQQSHYTIHLQSDTALSLPDHVLVTAVAWERLLLSRFSNVGTLLFFTVKFFFLVLLSILPFFLFPPNLDRWFFPIQMCFSQAPPTCLPKSKDGQIAQIVHITGSNQVFSFFPSWNQTVLEDHFSELQHFAVLSPFFQSQLNYHWAPGTGCFQGNSMEIGTQINCEVHILALEGIFIFLCIIDLLLGTWYENWQRDRISIIPK